MGSDILGYIAGSMTTLAYLPQVLKVFKTKQTQDLSFGMFTFSTIGIAMWLIYGIVTNSTPVIIANSVTFGLSAYILFSKLRLG